jgi:hypothetical protein
MALGLAPTWKAVSYLRNRGHVVLEQDFPQITVVLLERDRTASPSQPAE